jgi:D-alanine-D-alanine ligase
MNKRSVLLVFGGESSEHDVSIMSAKNVRAALDDSKYDVTLCYVSRYGEWQHVSSFDDLNGQALLPRLGKKAFMSNEGELTFDVIVPVLHGRHGEDGEVQGLASLLHIPCAGPSLIGAAITMDKDIAKRLMRTHGVPVVDWLTWKPGMDRPTYETIRAKLGGTVFVKPANAGSSVGVSKVDSEAELDAALNLAAEHDPIVIIERAVAAREVEVAVLGNNAPFATAPGEIIPGEDFYTYADKYSETSTSASRIPAELSADISEKIRSYAITAYQATRGYGMARVDFFVTEQGQIYCNEINSIPGFTNISMYPKLWEAEGVSQTELIDRLISAALE